MIPIAPAYFGVFYLRARIWTLGIAGVLVSATLICMVFLSIRKPHRWVVLLAHCVVLLYWFVGFALIAIGDTA